MKTKITTLLLSLALMASMTAPAFAADAKEAASRTEDLRPVISADETAAENGMLTRGELVAMLHEQAGKPVVNYVMTYTDVETGDPYAEAIRWASSEQIVNGYGNDVFGPDDAVTREQMAVILYRYAQKQGAGFTGAWAFPLPYDDAAAVSEYAYEAMCWMTMKGVMDAVESNMLAPRGQVTREEADATFAQFLAVLEKA